MESFCTLELDQEPRTKFNMLEIQILLSFRERERSCKNWNDFWHLRSKNPEETVRKTKTIFGRPDEPCRINFIIDGKILPFKQVSKVKNKIRARRFYSPKCWKKLRLPILRRSLKIGVHKNHYTIFGFRSSLNAKTQAGRSSTTVFADWVLKIRSANM